MEAIKKFGIALNLHFGIGIWFDYAYFKSIIIQLPILTLRFSLSSRAAKGVNTFNGITDYIKRNAK